jgi:hypothetical protein
MPRQDWKRIGVNLSQDELDMLKSLCAETGLSQTRQIALLIRREYRMELAERDATREPIAEAA